jgi:putative addiction module component (TIGR02574 family)
MSHPSLPFDIKQLSIAERIVLVEQIWDSITEEQQSLPVTKAQQDALDRRLDAYAASPNEGIAWEELKARLKQQ